MQNGVPVKFARRLFGGRFVAIACALVFLQFAARAQNPGRQALHDHVPKAVARLHLQPIEKLSAAKHLNLAIGLPLRNKEALDDLLQQIYDPASPNFRQYLTPEQFTEMFGPTEQDYQAVIAFARANGLTITATHPNRVVLDVSGTAADIEKMFHVTIRTYRHPKENRDFYAPDAEPSIDMPVPILHISGLDNFALPRPNLKIPPAGQTAISKAFGANATPNSGSGPGGSYRGYDFRAAYVPGTTLTGSGQKVGLLQFDGYYPSDIAAYVSQTGLPSVPLTVVPINGGVSSPGGNNVEVALDIEMVISMAPGVSEIIVYEAPNPSPWSSLLSRMANDNLAKQLSCSWGESSPGSPDPTSEQIFKQMAAQGQSFFNATGDSDAFVSGIPFPSESTNITQVGGTTLSTTGPGGSYVSETVWNWGLVGDKYLGSGGGISANYSIPSWQQGIDMSTNHGSTTMRNVPDVALTGDDVWVAYDNGSSSVVGGTSCAAPLWAGFTALVNQQAASAGRPVVGFVNPAIYAIGKNGDYAAGFHDIITGNNTWSGSPTNFYAVAGYDLCTGWGTPAGQSLINDLVGLTDQLGVTPSTNFSAISVPGVAFNITSQIYSLTNWGTASLSWSLINTSSWLNASAISGTLAPDGGSSNVTINLTSATTNLSIGTYIANVWFSNVTTHVAQNRQFVLQVVQPLQIIPSTGFSASGLVGGPFNVASQSYALTNLGTASMDWSIINTSSWLNVAPGSGTLAPGESSTVTASLTSTASNLAAGTYATTLVFTNTTVHTAQNLQFTLLVGQSVIQNGGFETGDFSAWTLIGGANQNAVVNYPAQFVHSGTYGAFLGNVGSLGYLYQTLPTLPGQSYLLSYWLINPNNTIYGPVVIPNQFLVQWNGSAIFNLTNVGAINNWTNMLFIVTATGTNSVLQFGARNDPAAFGLDDINVWPIPTPSFRSVAKVTNNAVALTWNSLTSLVYRVEYSINLARTNWTILSTNTANSFTLTVTNSIGTNRQRFYRIRQLP